MATTSVPFNIVERLKKMGYTRIIKELKSEHGIEANGENKGILTLNGDDDEILDLAIDMLAKKVGITSEFFDDNKVKKELGGNRRVKWTFTDRQALNIKHLFNAQVDKLKEKYEVIVSYGGDTGKVKSSKSSKAKCATETLMLSCPYNQHSEVGEEIKQLQSAVQNCKIQKETVNKQYKQTAIKFADKQTDGHYYCEWETDKLIIWGKDSKSIEVALNLWKTLTKTNTKDGTKQSEAEYHNYEGTQAKTEPNTVDPKELDTINDVEAYTSSSQLAQTFNVNSEESDDKWEDNMAAANTIERKPGKWTGNGKNAKYCFEVNRLKVQIYNHSITEIKDTDAITNAANDKMMHGGGVAHYISKAAGSAMDEDCKKYIKEHTKLYVTKNFVSIPGKIKCKGIIHAVGPIWSEYQDKVCCAKDLYTTMWNVLDTTSSRGWRKVAITAISSGIYGVPKKLCAEMYIKAFVDYSCESGDALEVHFVDLNEDILRLVRTAYDDWVTDPSSLSYHHALTYIDKQSSNKQTGVPVLQLIGESVISYSGEKVKKYRVNERLTLCAYQGDLTRLSKVDVIAIPVSSKGDGALVKKFKDLFGQPYATCVDRTRKSSENIVYVYQSRQGRPDLANIMLTLNEGAPWKQQQTLSNVFKSLLCYQYKGKKSLAMPLLGLGYSESNQKSAEEISELLIQTIMDVADENIRIQELHLVNYGSPTSTSVQTVLNRRYSEHWIKHMPIDNTMFKVAQTTAITTKPRTSSGASLSIGLGCPICFETIKKPKELPCTHVLCSVCYDNVLKHKPQCPSCSFIFGVIKGNQPPGVMYYRFDEHQYLPGFESERCGVITIYYRFQDGKQSENHPDPGQNYKGISRMAYLPNNKEGKEVLELLRVAYDRKLVFTIGDSTTSGEKGVITWNDIHHKTNPRGGQQSFGYPDPTYLQRVREELKDKGVVPPQTKNKLYPNLPLK